MDLEFIDNIPELRWMKDMKYLVYSGAKCGGATVSCSLKYCYYTHANHHFQIVVPDAGKHNITIKDMISYIRENKKEKPLIISIYREPIARTISAFFQVHPHFVKIPNPTLDDFLSIFNDWYMLPSEEYQPMFDKETLGIDIWEHEFDKEKGYQLYENDDIKLLVLRFDTISQWDTIIPQFLTEEQKVDFTFFPANLSEDKSYADLYDEFKKNFKVTKFMLDQKIANNMKYLEYFYSEKDIKAILDKWYSYCLPTDQKHLRIPETFEWEKYRELNPDIPHVEVANEIYAKFHWLTYGNIEGRKYEEFYDINIIKFTSYDRSYFVRLLQIRLGFQDQLFYIQQ